MDTDWDISAVDRSQYRSLFMTLGSIAGIKDVGLNPDGLRLVHTPDALQAIEKAFAANNLKLKRVVHNERIRTQIHIPEMDCPTEEGLIRGKLNAMKGVSDLEFNLMNRVLTVSHDEHLLEEICGVIRSLGYTPNIQKEATKKNTLSEFKTTKISWWRYGFGLVLATFSEIAHFLDYPEWSSIIPAVLAVLVVGLKTYKKGFIALKNFNFNMNALMAVAVTGAFCIGNWPEGAMVMVLFEISEAIESLSLDRARNAIRSLLNLTPEKARVQQADGSWDEIKANLIEPGMIIRVNPGERLVVDGIVKAGFTSINQAPITGESIPVEKKVGDSVYAGTINEHGSFDYEATSSAENSMPARIISAIESAQSSRAPTQRFVDSFARIYTPCVFLLAFATAILPPLFWGSDWHEWIYRGLTLLVIACPCALVISTPVTIVSALATAAKRGILIKGGVYLEKGRTLQTIALDKTGTITEGKPSVMAIEYLLSDSDPVWILKRVTAIANRNQHPISRAVETYAVQSGVDLTQLEEVHGYQLIPGNGVIATISDEEYYLGNLIGLDRYYLQNENIRRIAHVMQEKGLSPLFFASSKEVIAVFGIADQIRDLAKESISELKQMNIKLVMLTGDTTSTARSVAQEVGIDSVKSELLPSDKQKLIDNFAKREVIGMVGDGINDAPALARADIGFAMGAIGTDTAIETADVAFMDDDLRKLPEFIQLSKDTFTILIQNILIALGIKLVFLVLTYMGLATMWMAVFADTGTCLIVVANALRMLNWKK